MFEIQPGEEVETGGFLELTEAPGAGELLTVCLWRFSLITVFSSQNSIKS